MGKQIIYCPMIQAEKREIWTNLAKTKFAFILFPSDEGIPSTFSSLKGYFYNQKKPIIAVTKIHPELPNLEFTILLKGELECEGYTTITVLNSGSAKLVNAIQIPSELINEDQNNVLTINHFIEALARQGRADVILEQYPGGLQKYDDEIGSDCGVSSYIFSKANPPDYMFCILPYGFYDAGIVQMLSQAFTYKFSCPISALIISNMQINGFLSHDAHKLIYDYVSNDAVETALHKYMKLDPKIPMYNLSNPQTPHDILLDILK